MRTIPGSCQCLWEADHICVGRGQATLPVGDKGSMLGVSNH